MALCAIPGTPEFEEAKVRMREGFDNARYALQEFGGIMRPRTSAKSQAAADAIAHHDAVSIAVERAAPNYIDRIIPNPDENFRKLIGSAIVEQRLRHMKEYYKQEVHNQSNAAHDARTAARAALQNKDRAEARRLLKEARKGSRNATEAIKLRDGVTTAIGTKWSSLPDEATYQRVVSSPQFQEATNNYKQHFVPDAEQWFRDAQGISETDPINAPTQIPGFPVSLTPIRDSHGHVQSSAGKMSNVKLRSLKYAEQAKGNAESYETDFAKMIAESLRQRMKAATKAKMIRTLGAEGLGEWGPNSSGITPYELKDLRPPKGTQNNQAGETSFYLKDPGVYHEARTSLGDERRWGKIPGADILTKLQIIGLQDFVFHGGNLATGWLKAGIGNTIRALKHNWQKKPEFQKQLVELATIGAAKGKHSEAGLLWGGKYDPSLWSSKILNFLDESMRVALSRQFDRMVERNLFKPGEGNKRNFVNTALGQYNAKAQQGAVRFFRETGLGAFATAGSQFLMESGRRLVLAPGAKTTGVKADLTVRAEMLGRVVAVLAAVAATNVAAWGNPLGDDDTPFGAIKTGQSGGKTQYFDLLRFTGITRGLRETGLLAIMNGIRHEERPARVIDKATSDIYHSIMHPFAGPAVQFASTFISGKDPSGHPVAHPKPGESRAWANIKAAALSANPIIAGFSGAGHEEGDVPPLSERLLEMAGPFSPKLAHFPRVIQNYQDRLRTLTDERQHARQRGQRFEQERDYQRLHRIEQRMNQLTNALRGRRIVNGRIRIGEPPSPAEAERIQQMRVGLARAALGR